MSERSTERGVFELAEGNSLARPAAQVRRCLLVLLTFVLVLYWLALNPHWRFQRDSAVYLGLGRSLVEDGTYTFNMLPNTRYPPGFPLMLAAVTPETGFPEIPYDSFLPYNVLTSLMGLGCIALAWLLFRQMRLSPRVALLCLLPLALSRTLYYYSSHIMTDVPYTFLAVTALWATLRAERCRRGSQWAWWCAAGLLIAAAGSVRAIGPLVAVAVTMKLWVSHNRLQRWRGRLLKTALLWTPFAIALTAWILWAEATGEAVRYFRGRLRPAALLRLIGVFFTQWREHLGGLTDAVCGTDLGTEVGGLLAALMVLGIVRALRRGERTVTLYALLTVIAVLASGWSLDRRYLLPVLPVLLYWLVLGAQVPGHWLRTRTRWWTRGRVRRLGWVLMSLLLAVNLVRIGKVVAQQRSPRFYDIVEQGAVEDYGRLSEWLRRHAEPDATVLCYEHRVVHYFSRLHTYPLPRDTTEHRLRWLSALGKSGEVDYVIWDARHERGNSVIDRMRQQRPDTLRPVLVVGQVQLLRLRVPPAPPPGSRAARPGTPPWSIRYAGDRAVALADVHAVRDERLLQFDAVDIARRNAPLQ